MALSPGGFVAGPNGEPGGSHDRFFPPSGRREATDAAVVGQRDELVTGPYADLLLRLPKLPPRWALPQAAHLLSRLTKDAGFLRREVLPALREASGVEDWRVARRYADGEGSCSLQIFVWPPGTGTRVHDHSSWGAYRCVFGSVLEERYERLDDGSRQGHARLKKVWQLAWGPQDGVSTVLPGDGGIHRVTNSGESAAVSVHFYGPRLGEADGRDYDPARDHVCDRRD
jgi:predicted metal-dependent enzyme (double-stranded beta helix superfamily)